MGKGFWGALALFFFGWAWVIGIFGLKKVLLVTIGGALLVILFGWVNTKPFSSERLRGPVKWKEKRT